MSGSSIFAVVGSHFFNHLKGSVVNKAVLSLSLLIALAACSKDNDESANPLAAAEAAQEAQSAPVPTLTGAEFKAPLPEGVVLKQPFHARLDIPAPKKDGPAGRRVEFEYLEGDAVQAMAKFATAMTAAGFQSPKGPSVKGGVVRQVFSKDGYGTVNARAQEEDAGKRKHEAARGFVVVAWPKTVAATAAPST